MLIRENLYTHKKSRDEDMATHIAKVEELCVKLENLEEPVGEEVKTSRIVCGLGSQYRNFISA